MARGTTVAVGFSEAVTGATIVVTDDASHVIAGSTSYNVTTNTATFTPSGLLNQETTFTVSVSGATNVAGAQMLPASWSFTTTAPPAVTSKTPAPNATGVALLTTIVAGFDRAVVAGSTSFRLVDSGANVIAGTTNLDGEGAAATFTPTAALVPATTYTVTVSGTASSGGAIMAPVSWSFTTVARPTITGRTPAAGATAVDVNTPVAATFSQPVTGQTIVVTDPSSAVVPGTSDYDPDTNTATFTPAAPFDAAVTYSVAVSGATNDAGATMLPVSWSFATAIPPSVTSQTPTPGAAGVGLAYDGVRRIRPGRHARLDELRRGRGRHSGVGQRDPQRCGNRRDVHARRGARPEHDLHGDGVGCDLVGRRCHDARRLELHDCIGAGGHGADARTGRDERRREHDGGGRLRPGGDGRDDRGLRPVVHARRRIDRLQRVDEHRDLHAVGSVELGDDVLRRGVGRDERGGRGDDARVLVVHDHGDAVGDNADPGRRRDGSRTGHDRGGRFRPGRRRRFDDVPGGRREHTGLGHRGVERSGNPRNVHAERGARAEHDLHGDGLRFGFDRQRTDGARLVDLHDRGTVRR